MSDAEAQGLPPIRAWTLHDFRRAGVSFLAEKQIKLAVADKLLAHAKSVDLPGVAGTYQRYDFMPERLSALQLWADHLTGDYCLAAASRDVAGAELIPALDPDASSDARANAGSILMMQAGQLGFGRSRSI
jgi:hypothetical protein